jgi:flagellar biosynthesis GTPase FlhF
MPLNIQRKKKPAKIFIPSKRKAKIEQILYYLFTLICLAAAIYIPVVIYRVYQTPAGEENKTPATDFVAGSKISEGVKGNFHEESGSLSSQFKTKKDENKDSGEKLPFCSRWIESECKRLLLPEGSCDFLIEQAKKLSEKSDMVTCITEFSGKIAEMKKSAGSLEKINLSEESKGLPNLGVINEAGKAVEKTDEEKKEEKKEQTTATMPEDNRTPEEKISKIREISRLMKEIQTASYNYTTNPATQQERIEKLKNLIEAEKDPELKRVYSDLINDMHSPYQGNADPSKGMDPSGTGVKGVDINKVGIDPSSNQENKYTTPQLEKLKNLEAELKNQSPEVPSAPAQNFPSTSTVVPQAVTPIDPGQQAPVQSQDLTPVNP